MLCRVTTESPEAAADAQTCAHCGRRSEQLFPRDPVGRVCPTCYESLGRQRPEWSRLEIAGVVSLMIGSGLIVVGLIALVALLVR